MTALVSRLLWLVVSRRVVLRKLSINDMTRTTKDCRIQIYADDTVIYFSHENSNIIEETSANEMRNIAGWLDNSRFIINRKKEKTGAMLFGTGKRLHSQGD